MKLENNTLQRIIQKRFNERQTRQAKGTWSDNDALSVNVFAVRVEGDEIQVQVPEREE